MKPREITIGLLLSLGGLLLYCLACTPSWSPDGKKLAYTLWCGAGPDANSGVYIYDREQKRTRIVVECNGLLGSPAWAPDGKSLAFSQRRDVPPASPKKDEDKKEGKQAPPKQPSTPSKPEAPPKPVMKPSELSLYRYWPESDDLRLVSRLTVVSDEGPADERRLDAQLQWSPDGNHILWTLFDRTAVVDANTGKETARIVGGGFVRFSPSGEQAALILGGEGPDAPSFLVVVRSNQLAEFNAEFQELATRSKEVNLEMLRRLKTVTFAESSAAAPRDESGKSFFWPPPLWCRDGTQLAVSGLADVLLYDMQTHGKKALKLGKKEEPVVWLDWSPKADRLAYILGGGERGGSVFVTALDDPKPKPLSLRIGNTLGFMYSVWSPDGTTLAYAMGLGKRQCMMVKDVTSGQSQVLGMRQWVRLLVKRNGFWETFPYLDDPEDVLRELAGLGSADEDAGSLFAEALAADLSVCDQLIADEDGEPKKRALALRGCYRFMWGDFGGALHDLENVRTRVGCDGQKLPADVKATLCRLEVDCLLALGRKDDARKFAIENGEQALWNKCDQALKKASGLQQKLGPKLENATAADAPALVQLADLCYELLFDYEQCKQASQRLIALAPKSPLVSSAERRLEQIRFFSQLRAAVSAESARQAE